MTERAKYADRGDAINSANTSPTGVALLGIDLISLIKSSARVQVKSVILSTGLFANLPGRFIGNGFHKDAEVALTFKIAYIN